jgi:uncharacterized protein YacL (UPF0231 family)
MASETPHRDNPMIRCYRDEYGCNRVKMLRGHANIGFFLEDDVQSGISGCKEYLDIVRSIEEEQRVEWSGTGNSHTVTIRRDGVTIENVWAEGFGTEKLSLPEFKKCLEAWLALISGE